MYLWKGLNKTMREIKINIDEINEMIPECLDEYSFSEVENFISNAISYIKENYSHLIEDEYNREMSECFEIYSNSYIDKIYILSEDFLNGDVIYLENWCEIVDLMITARTCDVNIFWEDGVYYISKN